LKKFSDGVKAKRSCPWMGYADRPDFSRTFLASVGDAKHAPSMGSRGVGY